MSSISIPFPNKLAFGFSRYLNSTATDKPRRNRHIRRQLTTTEFENSDLNFATTIVHEVRNPLSNIYLAIEMLQSEIIDSELKMYLDIIKRSATRINSVVNNLLNKRSSEDVIAEYLRAFQNAYPKQFSMAEQVKSIIKENDIFEAQGYRKAMASILDLWKLNDFLQMAD